MTNYEKGRAGEYEVKRLMENRGYYVFRTAGSHSPVDLICLKQDYGVQPPVLIQVKRGIKPSPGNWRSLLELRVTADKMVFYREDGKEWSKIALQ